MVNTDPLLAFSKDDRLQDPGPRRLAGIKEHTKIELPLQLGGTAVIDDLYHAGKDNPLKTLLDIGATEHACFLAELPQAQGQGRRAADRIAIRAHMSGNQYF